MDSLEEITPLQVKEMTREQALELYMARQALVYRLKQEMQILTPKAFPQEKKIIDAEQAQMEAGWRKPVEKPKCSLCGSTDIMPQKGNRVFCRQCNISSEVI